ncbi:MAG: hypothetical protein P1P77_04595 [Spirochaetaceae bacterium]|nr:hypothetical protein [Spirochaetaceae bacterium]
MRDPEYDRFGPWILEITDKDPIPLIFEPYVNLDESEYAFKVPRPMERRELSPGMNLYDYLVVFFPSYMTILQRSGEEVAKSDIRYNVVVTVEHIEDLLDGRLRIYTEDDVFEIYYSTVSADIIENAVKGICRRYIPDKPPTEIMPTPPALLPDIDGLSFYFNGLLRELKERKTGQEHAPELIGFQSETKVSSLENRWWARLFYGAINVKLQESMHFIDSSELRIVDRGRLWKYRWQLVMGKRSRFIPVHRIDTIEIAETKITAEVWQLSIRTAVHSHVFLLSSDSPLVEFYRRFNH